MDRLQSYSSHTPVILQTCIMQLLEQDLNAASALAIHWGAGPNWGRRLIDSDVSAKTPQPSGWFHMVSYGFKWFQMVSNGFKWFQMVSNGFKWFKDSSNDRRKNAPIYPYQFGHCCCESQYPNCLTLCFIGGMGLLPNYLKVSSFSSHVAQNDVLVLVPYFFPDTYIILYQHVKRC